ncbi:MAG: AraC family transcriptional regulator [Saprospiraceae bacterium]|jgi:AraC-like DNA-binding protein|nr:helix-turn-helix domain-containing protein [Saprospiraceae bacterium]
MVKYLEEITVLTPNDCFLHAVREKTDYDFPIHKHPEIELNLILHSKGALRVIGDHIGEISNVELVLVGSNLPHGWLTHKYQFVDQPQKIKEVTIQFHENILDSLIERNQLIYLKEMMAKASGGIFFGEKTIHKVKDKIISLSTDKGFYSVMELLMILHDLSLADDTKILCDEKVNFYENHKKNERLGKILNYMHDHFQKDISLSEIAKVSGMTTISFNRFIKKNTGKTFIDLLIQIRLGHAYNLLIDSNYTVSEIAFRCGFKNVSYFNRAFKTNKNKTPLQFRHEFLTCCKRTIV